MKAIGYIRVSTSQQVEQGVSMEAQKRKIESYCDLKDINLVEIVSDAGISGSKSNREGYQRVLSLKVMVKRQAEMFPLVIHLLKTARHLLKTYKSKRL